MLILVGFFAAVIGATLLSRAGFWRSGAAPDLGWMSEQWLAEHRASLQR
jgi:hypothetical protein